MTDKLLSEDAEREAIARIIDPAVWANLGWRTRMGHDPDRDTKSSLAKADRIIALRSEARRPLVEALEKLRADAIWAQSGPMELYSRRFAELDDQLDAILAQARSALSTISGEAADA